MCNDRPVDSSKNVGGSRNVAEEQATTDADSPQLQGILIVNVEEMSLEQLEMMQEQFHSMVQRRKRERTELEKHSMCKRLKPETCMDSPKDAASYRQPGIPIPPEVLRLIARGGFLRSQDLGKLLLLSSKSIVTTLTSDFVYNLLYETRLKDRWASPTRGKNEWVPNSVLQARGYESILKSMESPPDVKTKIVAFPSLPNPKPVLHPNNTVVILSFWILSQKIYSHQLTLDEIQSLTKTGHCDLTSQESLFQIINLCFEKNKTFPQKLQEIRQKNINTSSNNKNSRDSSACLVVAKIHGIRLDTNQTCTFYDSNLPRFELQRTHAEPNQVKFPIQRALRNTDQGDRWIAQWFHHGWPEGIQNFGGLTFSVTLKKNEIHIESVVFGEPGRSEYLQTRHGISPFHIMEGLAGWH
ncbi:hypothetical protein IV203_030993 [Nitzschia inconspicua]|uniref:Uncharacterized protein n=1 Tax=Nitzschia inconspicua TaxID=303405 RepID=A0A9K3LUQ0_9STRA|nr:hypothetical protein IV203_030993 [Nitzschia inconspicua]